MRSLSDMVSKKVVQDVTLANMIGRGRSVGLGDGVGVGRTDRLEVTSIRSPFDGGRRA